MNKEKLVKFKKMMSLLMLLAALLVYVGIVWMNKNKTIIITGFALMIVAMIVDWKLCRCPYCHKYINKKFIGNKCPNCGKDLTEVK